MLMTTVPEAPPTRVLHVDGDTFFASCEIAMDASLSGRRGQLEKLSAADTRISDAGAREIALASPGLEKLFVNGASHFSRNVHFYWPIGSQTRLAEQVR